MEQDANTYTAYGTYYDDIMLSGYFNHEESALALTKILGNRKTVLDLGIGTGMLTEKMLSLSDRYNIVGIDFSDRMLKQAKSRLQSFKNVVLIANDVRHQTFARTFDAVISTAGPISITYRPAQQQHRLFSYCVDKEEHLKFIQKLSTWLDTDDLLLISIQEQHQDREIPLLQSGLTYRQTVIFSHQNLFKTYSFWDGEMKVDEQTIKTIYFDEVEFNQLFKRVGLHYQGNDPSNNFCVYKKEGVV